MTYKDCFHSDVCGFECDDALTFCKDFKDKSHIIELPNIEIGQELFYIDKYEKRVKSDTVSKLTFEKNDLGVYTGVWSENYGFSMFFSDVGKNLFISKEEAEAKLKEVNEK